MISMTRIFHLSGLQAFALVAMFLLPQTSSAWVIQRGVVQTVDGKEIPVDVKTIDRTGLLDGTGLPASIELKSVLRFTTGNQPQPVSYPVAIYLASKPIASESESKTVLPFRIGVDTASLSDEAVLLRNQVGAFKLPIQTVRAIVWSNSAVVEKSIATPSADEDRVIVQIGDRQQVVPGVIESIDTDSVAITYKNKVRTIAVEKVKAVVLADVGFKSPKGVLASVETTDGTVWRGAIKSMLADQADSNFVSLNLEIAGSAVVKIDIQKIVAVDVDSDRLAMLSDLTPIDVRESTDFVVARPYQKDRNVVGGPLRVLGSDGNNIEFRKGLGTQATSRIDFRNDKEFTQFAATVGIDLATAGRGDCRVVVRADGVEKWNQRIVAGESAKSFNIDIRGSEQISLIVLPGREFDLADHVNWCEPRFIKTEQR